MLALRIACWARVRWPPAMWPVSCASTPISWFGVSRAHDQAGIDEFVLPAGDKGVELLVLDQIDVERARLEPGRLPDRRHHRPDIGLDLGVPDEGFGRGGSGDGQRARHNDRHCPNVTSKGHRGRL